MFFYIISISDMNLLEVDLEKYEKSCNPKVLILHIEGLKVNILAYYNRSF